MKDIYLPFTTVTRRKTVDDSFHFHIKIFKIRKNVHYSKQKRNIKISNARFGHKNVFYSTEKIKMFYKLNQKRGRVGRAYVMTERPRQYCGTICIYNFQCCFLISRLFLQASNNLTLGQNYLNSKQFVTFFIKLFFSKTS